MTALAVIANVFVGRVIRDLAIYGLTRDFVEAVFLIIGFAGPVSVIINLIRFDDPRCQNYLPIPRMIVTGLYCAMIVCAGFVRWQDRIVDPIVEVFWSIGSMLGEADDNISFVSTANATTEPAPIQTKALQGLIYLDDVKDESFADLNSRRVASRSRQGVLVTEALDIITVVKGEKTVKVFDPDAFLAFVAAEHLSQRELGLSYSPRVMYDSKANVSELTRQSLMADFLVNFSGQNRESALCNVVSQDGARGLGQITSGTFRSIARFYPNAGLSSNTKTGICNHVQVFKFLYLFFDDALTQVPNSVLGHVASLSFRERFYVGAYNAGPSAASSAVARYRNGSEWRERGLKIETQMLIKKFIWAKDEIKRLKLSLSTT